MPVAFLCVTSSESFVEMQGMDASIHLAEATLLLEPGMRSRVLADLQQILPAVVSQGSLTLQAQARPPCDGFLIHTMDWQGCNAAATCHQSGAMDSALRKSSQTDMVAFGLSILMPLCWTPAAPCTGTEPADRAGTS